MFLSLFEEFDTFPELYGTCGELYVVEELQPLDIPHLLGTVGIMSASKRIEYKEVAPYTKIRCFRKGNVRY